LDNLLKQMADTGIFATTLQVQEKAGANASAVANTEAYINSYIAQAESEINVAVRYNFSDVYGTLNVDVKGILTKVASCLAAIDVITYDMSNFSSRGEAEDMINVHRDTALRGIAILRDKKQETFIIKA
tara:strand:+ start:1807 stop:2193 length:387 start_codon:yes stop_codon:yes gene_type:complete